MHENLYCFLILTVISMSPRIHWHGNFQSAYSLIKLTFPFAVHDKGESYLRSSPKFLYSFLDPYPTPVSHLEKGGINTYWMWLSAEKSEFGLVSVNPACLEWEKLPWKVTKCTKVIVLTAQNSWVRLGGQYFFLFPGIVCLLDKAVSRGSKQGTHWTRMYFLANLFASLGL